MSFLRLGTRGSHLALVQSRTIKAKLESDGSTVVELEVIRTKGDANLLEPLPAIGGKGLFTQELDQAILDKRIDLAVHSLKDLPTELPDGLCLAAVPARVDYRDVLVGSRGERITLASLKKGSVVGTSSLRRAALLRAFRKDIECRSIRGNVDTRISKVDNGSYDAVILAAAGLIRLGIEDRAMEWLDITSWLPAPGQGALGIITRIDDAETLSLVKSLNDQYTQLAVNAERVLLENLGGGCQVPIGALGVTHGDIIRLRGLVVSCDGTKMVRGDITGSAIDPREVGVRLANILKQQGAEVILREVFDSFSKDHPN